MYRARLVISTVALLPLLIGLGVWQLDRYQEKQTIENDLNQRSHQTLTFAELQTREDPRFYAVSLSGRFNNDRYFLLDNRIFQGRVGYHVLMPFQTTSGETVLVDRGWISGSQDRSRLPTVLGIHGLTTISGQSWQPDEAFLLAEDVWSNNWPKVIQAVDSAAMADALEVQLPPWLVILDNQQPGSLQRNFEPINTQSERHLGYAIQWFALAITLIVLAGWALRKNNNNNVVLHQEDSNE